MAEPNPDARTNQQFIQSIKEKYNSARNALNGQNKPSESLANPSLRNQASHTPVKTLNSNPSQARLDRSLISKDYDTLRRKYEDRANRPAPNDAPEVKDEERAGAKESTNKSSPIKRFYQTGKSENFLAARRQQIQQAHQARASQHRAERELDMRAIANIDCLLASIRNTFSGYKYQSK